MQNAAGEAVSLIMTGLGAYFVFRHHVWGYPIEYVDVWEARLKIGLVALVITAPLQVVHGDLYAQHVAETKPQKFAAMEAVWETNSDVSEYIVAVPTSVKDLLDPRAKDVFGSASPAAPRGSPATATPTPPSRDWRSSRARTLPSPSSSGRSA
jgi:cytochrome d ubiquinol oxidase subunit I